MLKNIEDLKIDEYVIASLESNKAGEPLHAIFKFKGFHIYTDSKECCCVYLEDAAYEITTELHTSINQKFEVREDDKEYDLLWVWDFYHELGIEYEV